MDQQPTRVALVMPVFNRRDITLQCLRSLRRVDATGLEIRIFVIDDGSKDGTSDAIRRDFPEVELIAGDGTLHYAAGTNRGIEAAMKWNADFVVTMNDDAVYHDQFLHRLIATATANPHSIVGALLLLWSEPHRVFQVDVKWKTLRGGWTMRDDLTAFSVGAEPFEVEGIVGNCVMIPAEAIRQCGLMDEVKFPHGWGDAQYIARFRKAGWKLLLDPRALVWCEPNTYPPALHTMSPGRILDVLLRDRRHPQNLQRQLIARLESAPTKPAAAIAFLAYCVDLSAKAAKYGVKRLLGKGKMPDSNVPMPLSERLGSSFLRLVRVYTRHFPVEKGKFRLISLALSLSPGLPPRAIVKTKDNCPVRADIRSGMHTLVYFLGDYEPAISDIVRTLVDPGDICVDAGANFGWFSILFHKLTGEKGQVHAFEPVPATFAELTENYILAGSPANLSINNAALAERSGELTISLFEGMPSGHASLSDQGRDDAVSFSCVSLPLDDYLANKEIHKVDFVKVDIEGAELGFLKGAVSCLSQARPPTIIMEMALNQTRNFGYAPDDLIKFISSHGDYSFFKVIESTRELEQIDGFEESDIGANVLCVSACRYALLDRLASWIR